MKSYESYGIICDRCKKKRNKEVKMRVDCSLPQDNIVVRYRKCPECGATKKTIET